MINLNTDGDKGGESCEICCYRVKDECHFCSPSVVGDGRWPKIEREEWCGRYKLIRKKSPRATDAAIVAIMDVAGELKYEDFAARVAADFGIHPRSAGIRVERLIARRKLKEDNGVVTLAPARKPGRPKANEPEIPEPTEYAGSCLGRWYEALQKEFGGPIDAGMFSNLRDSAREASPISNAAFGTMLKAALEAGEVIKTDDRTYWIPIRASKTAEVAPTIEAPEEIQSKS